MLRRRARSDGVTEELAQRLAGLTADEVDRCYVIRHGSALLADDGALIAFLLPSEAILWPEAAPSITATLNRTLIEDLIASSKLYELALARRPRGRSPFRCSRAEFEAMIAGGTHERSVSSIEEIVDVV